MNSMKLALKFLRETSVRDIIESLSYFSFHSVHSSIVVVFIIVILVINYYLRNHIFHAFDFISTLHLEFFKNESKRNKPIVFSYALTRSCSPSPWQRS